MLRNDRGRVGCATGGLGTLFIFPMNRRTSVPRNRKEEKMVDEAAQQTVEEIAPAEE